MRHRFAMLLQLSLPLIILLFASSVFAQTGETDVQKIKKYRISFPIVTLGNCASLAACKNYCSDITHKDACIAYARSKGFYKEGQVLTFAKEEIGCSSLASCQTFCEKQENKETCTEFAKKHGHLVQLVQKNLESK